MGETFRVISSPVCKSHFYISSEGFLGHIHIVIYSINEDKNIEYNWGEAILTYK